MTPQTVAQQAPLSMGFSRQGFWSGLPFPLPEDFPESGMELRFYSLQADSLPSEPPRCSPDSLQFKGNVLSDSFCFRYTRLVLSSNSEIKYEFQSFVELNFLANQQLKNRVAYINQ